MHQCWVLWRVPFPDHLALLGFLGSIRHSGTRIMRARVESPSSLSQSPATSATLGSCKAQVAENSIALGLRVFYFLQVLYSLCCGWYHLMCRRPRCVLACGTMQALCVCPITHRPLLQCPPGQLSRWCWEPMSLCLLLIRWYVWSMTGRNNKWALMKEASVLSCRRQTANRNCFVDEIFPKNSSPSSA